MNDEDREVLDNAYPEDEKQASIDVLREGDGAKLRGLLNALRSCNELLEAVKLAARAI